MHQQRRDPLEGAIVDGRYTVHSRLARGGMSTVYLATDRRLDRRVALKVLYPHLADEPGFVVRFEQEAKSAARLSHPNVVGVLDQGVDDIEDQTVAYLVMEFVEGRTLRDVLRDQGRLTPRQALGYLADVVKGLAAAHDAGLIHRDVKPENVLLSTTGVVKIADFGLARAVSATTGTATLVGTVAYLSPELVLGKPAEAQSDIYSTGIMLYELLTGRQPFTGDMPVQVALQHAQADVPAPSLLLPGLAPDIDELVLWCTARDPEDRPIDGGALLGELQHIRSTLSAAELDHEAEDTRPTAAHQDHLTAAVVPRLPLHGAPTEALARSPRSRSQSDDGGRWPGEDHGHDGAFDSTTDSAFDRASSSVGSDIAGRTEVFGRFAGDGRADADGYAVDTGASDAAGQRSDGGATADTDPHSSNPTGFIARDPSVHRVIGAMPAVPPSSSPGQTRTHGTAHGTTHGTAQRTTLGTAPDGASRGGTERISASAPGAEHAGDLPGHDWNAPQPRSDTDASSPRRPGVGADQRTGMPQRTGSKARPLSRRQQARQAQRPLKSLQGRTARRSLRVMVVLLLLLAGLVAAAGWLFGAGPAGIVSLPDVANAPLSEARAALGQEGLASVSTEEVFHEEILAGLVIGTQPGAFSDVRRYELVEVIVSKGPELFRVPDLLGSTQVEAASALGAAGFTVGTVTEEYSETEATGQVLRQSLPAAAERRRDTAVDLVVSRGPRPIAVPDVVGLPEEEAVAALEAADLEAAVDDASAYSRSVPRGAVLAQAPSGADVPRGTTVSLTLSLGPRLVAVPNVFSLSEERAVAALEEAGFVVQIDYTFGSPVLGLVAGQSRTGDQPEGTTVRITVT